MTLKLTAWIAAFILGPISVLVTALVFCNTDSAPAARGRPIAESSACNLGSLPSDIQSLIRSDFGSWKIQEAKTLSDHSRKTWAGKEPLTCPGIAVGLFQNTKASYAVLLVPFDHPDAGYRFLVFSRKTGKTSHEAILVEQSDDSGASNYCIRRVSINKFFNEEFKRKFQVQALEAVLMVDSAEEEYEADIYFWSKGRFQKQPVDD